jgi:acetoacetyl-CoA synthetase
VTATRAAPEPRIAVFLRFLRETRGLDFDVATPEGYDRLWRWSCDDLPAFWQALWEFSAVASPTPHAAVLADDRMPGAVWFPGAQVNFARHAFSHADGAHAAGHPAIVFGDERLLPPVAIAWPELRRRVASFAAALRAQGVRPGDRVAAFLPNVPETMVAFLACASVGAVWSVCSPDMGPLAVLDRFRQIEPVVLVACDGYRHAGVAHDRRAVVRELVAALPSVRDVVFWANVDAGPLELPEGGPAVHAFADVEADPTAAFEPAWLPFDHPLWIVYSSGTTGLPKPIVHGHGGIVVESLKSGLHNDLGPSAETGDRYFWQSATGWIMWNSQAGALLGGVTVCMFDGAATGARKADPDWSTLWRFASASGATFFGAGAAFYASCLKADLHPGAAADLARIRAVGSTGSPLSADGYAWIRRELPKAADGSDVWICAISGGTDFAGAFVCGLRTLPVVDGEMQVRALAAAVEAWDEQGRPLVGRVGELVCTKPIPSMPLRFWNDPGDARYRESYFDAYPGVWRHGDWIEITPRGGAIIYGRSDATINRHGIRMGTAELYRAVEALPEVVDSLVVDLEYLGRESWMPLFVVLRDGLALDDAFAKRLKAAIRDALSARHVPNDVFQVPAIPRTLSGKKMELPVKKLLMGAAPESVFKLDAMANGDAVPWFVALAQRRAG